MSRDRSPSLIVDIPAALLPSWAAQLPQLLARFRPAALVIPPIGEALEEIVAAAKPLEIAILIGGDVEAAARTRAGGVYLSGSSNDVKRARVALGDAAIIGATCGLSRHAAMENAEAGADFVTFELTDTGGMEKASALCSWWQDITEIPAAIACKHLRSGIEALLEASPSFIFITERDLAGESLSFATELGLQGAS